jgi:hypothetical protein
MSLKTVMKIAECQIRGHKAPEKKKNELRNAPQNTIVNTYCERCNTPIKLIKGKGNTYRIQEFYTYQRVE